MAKLGYFCLLTAQGVPFLHAGDEFFRTKYGDANSYRSSDAVNQIDWKLKAEHWGLFDYVRRLIGLRRAHPVFRLSRREDVQARLRFLPHAWHDTLLAELDGAGLPGETWQKVLLAVNGSPDLEADFPLPSGDWEIVFEAAGACKGKIRVPPQTGVILRQLS
jgi:pullulanase